MFYRCISNVLAEPSPTRQGCTFRMFGVCLMPCDSLRGMLDARKSPRRST